MLTCFSKWLIYTASYLPLYIFYIGRVVLDNRDEEKVELIERILLNYNDFDKLIWMLTLLSILSVIVLVRLNIIRHNSRTYSQLKENVTIEIAGFLIPYIISALTVEIDIYGWIINFMVYIICGVIVIMADAIHLCPAFILAGYKLYKDFDEKYILTRLSKEQYNLLLLEDINGLQEKKLTANVSVVNV